MENKKKKGFLDKFLIKNSMDLPFFLLLLLVLAIGLVMLLSSSYFYAFYNTSGNDSLHYFKRQLFFAITGLFIMYVVSKLDYKYLRVVGVLGMAGSLFLLGIYFVFLGRTHIRLDYHYNGLGYPCNPVPPIFKLYNAYLFGFSV